MLVYEFMPNGTLREWISGKESSEIFLLKLEMSYILSLKIDRLLYVGCGYELFRFSYSCSLLSIFSFLLFLLAYQI